MSYCVNCGVELHSTCSVCPLCKTRVINPNQETDRLSPKPFPARKGTAEPARRSDVALLIGIVLAVTACVCGLLNLLVFRKSHWSLYVMGGCALLWIVCLPVFFRRMNPFLCLLLDGIGVSLYIGIIAWLHPGTGWYTALALPLVCTAAGLLCIFLAFVRLARTSILSRAALILGEVAFFTVAAELLICRYRRLPLAVTWSAVVLTCCVIIDTALITIIRRSRLREEVRRRMHI